MPPEEITNITPKKKRTNSLKGARVEDMELVTLTFERRDSGEKPPGIDDIAAILNAVGVILKVASAIRTRMGQSVADGPVRDLSKPLETLFKLPVNLVRPFKGSPNEDRSLLNTYRQFCSVRAINGPAEFRLKSIQQYNPTIVEIYCIAGSGLILLGAIHEFLVRRHRNKKKGELIEGLVEEALSDKGTPEKMNRITDALDTVSKQREAGIKEFINYLTMEKLKLSKVQLKEPE